MDISIWLNLNRFNVELIHERDHLVGFHAAILHQSVCRRLSSLSRWGRHPVLGPITMMVHYMHMNAKNWMRGVWCSLVILVFCSCSTVPETGRHQLRFVSGSEE